MPSVFEDYFRCPPEVCNLGVTANLPAEEGFFRLADAVCYGRQAAVAGSSLMNGRPLADVSPAVSMSAAGVLLPFDLDEVVTNLRQERYRQGGEHGVQSVTTSAAVEAAYYRLRPFLPVGVRRHLQRFRFRGWQDIAFPRWPVDTSVEDLMRSVMGLVVRARGESVPFIWFWPDGAPACTMMTHDVEGQEGLDFCEQLMDLDESFGIRSAFQLIPEDRGFVSRHLFDAIRRRGFEANIHDLNHDGRLFSNRELFLERVAEINRYAREFGSRGFRSGAMFRRQDWLESFEIDYDMSVPNVAHLEPQRGGCCTVMPYFVGRVLELPLTTSQDYTLFHILGDYSIERWEQQIQLILAQNGLLSFITHPDYLLTPRAQETYRQLLACLRGLRETGRTWEALPGELNEWWRNRLRMTLVADGQGWRIEGADSGLARIAWARLEGEQVIYEVEAGGNGRG